MTKADELLEKAVSHFPLLAEKSDICAILKHLFAGSDFLSDWLFRRTEDLKWLVSDDILTQKRNRAQMELALNEELEKAENDPGSALRIFKHKELARICARELSGRADLPTSLSEWSMVADVSLSRAISVAEENMQVLYGKPLYEENEGEEKKEAGISALALGKMGGEELNISSDIDIIFVHTSDNGVTSGPKEISLHEYFVKVARDAVRLLHDFTEYGQAFRVDLDLRPEGRSGEITNSIGAMEIYYESWGRSWERQALIKARHAGGRKDVSDEVLSRLFPFVYRKYLDRKAIEEIGAMKGAIDKNLASKNSSKKAGAKKSERNLKLGRGGIREIEFIVQSVQLLYGGRIGDLRVRGTLLALNAAHMAGLISKPHYTDLTEAYIFFRQIENRIQYKNGAQTHSLPEDEKLLALLAHQTGFDNVEDFERRVAEQRERVRQIFELHFGAEEDVESFPAELEDQEAICDWLDSLSFDRPKASAKLLLELKNGKPYSHPDQKYVDAFERFGKDLVLQSAKSPWPDNVLVGLSRFIDARKGRAIYSMIDNNRSLLKLLCTLFSSSQSLTDRVVRHPDLLDRLLSSDPIGRPPSRSDYAKEFHNAISGRFEIDEVVFRLNSARSYESLKTGLMRLLKLSDRYETMKWLTELAEEYVKALFKAITHVIGKAPDGGAIAIVAGGKLGKGEMNYGSDLDLVVVYDGDFEMKQWATKLVQQMVHLSKMMTPAGIGYEIDLRLRPDGAKGVLVPSLAFAADYYKKRAREWERIALVGARPIVGDELLCKKVMDILSAFVYEKEVTYDGIAQIAAVRKRMADEKTKQGQINLKFSRGGMVDIEFICQISAMLGKTDVKLPFTISTLREMTGRFEGAQKLVEAYELYRDMEDALRMDKEQAVNILPKNKTELTALGRKAGLSSATPAGIVTMITETRKEVRQIYDRYICALIER